MVYKVPFGGRAHFYTDEEVEFIADVARNAPNLTQGRYLAEFESRFTEYVGGSGSSYAVNNATSALELAAQLCLLQEGDEVIVPGHTFTASAYPFAKQGAKLVWADIDPDTRVVSVEALEACLTSKTKAIVVVHLYGYGANMPEIMEFARSHDLLVVEDVAQALGVEVDGQKVGTFGDFGVYSFHSHKNVTTLGEGGMLWVQEQSYQSLLPMLRHNGHCPYEAERESYWLPAMGDLKMPELDGRKLFPNNYCLGEVECALGARLLDRVDSVNEQKRERAQYFIDSLEPFGVLEFHKEFSARHSYHLMVAKVLDGKRDELIRALSQQHGVQCVVQYYPLYRYPFYQSLGFGVATCPATDDFFDNMISFPFGLNLSDSDIQYVIDATKASLERIL